MKEIVTEQYETQQHDRSTDSVEKDMKAQIGNEQNTEVHVNTTTEQQVVALPDSDTKPSVNEENTTENEPQEDMQQVQEQIRKRNRRSPRHLRAAGQRRRRPATEQQDNTTPAFIPVADQAQQTAITESSSKNAIQQAGNEAVATAAAAPSVETSKHVKQTIASEDHVIPKEVTEVEETPLMDEKTIEKADVSSAEDTSTITDSSAVTEAKIQHTTEPVIQETQPVVSLLC